SVGLPPEPLVQRVLDVLGSTPRSIPDLERAVDLRRGRLEALLKILDVDGAVRRADRGWVRTQAPWRYDHERVTRVQAARTAESEAMLAYAAADAGTCLMAFLRSSLDDPGAEPCGRCTVCTGAGDPVALDPAVVRAAVGFLRGVDVPIEPRKQWARGLDAPRGNIKPEARAEVGRALCRVDDAGWWPAVQHARDAGAPDAELVEGIAAALRRWPWGRRPRWVTWVPSATNGALLEATAAELGRLGTLPVHDVLRRTFAAPPQSATNNAAHRLRNVWGAFEVDEATLPPTDTLLGPVLVLDDTYDSGWTMTVVADRLRAAGAGSVLPFVLARG
ncbi:MAG: ATP-dependent helicase RecQ, partial [Acidimicrobiales bacterium]|nr:ATP-dependent helicase RecQ [Acidimicrobiales bacterium]